jgi:succinyl-diaminopimelate desuccinylase
MTRALDSHQLESLAQEIDRFVIDNKDRLFGLCGDLVAARSVNPPGRTVEAAAVVEAFLNENGIVCETLANVSEKPNLIARIEGGDAGRHLVLNGHLDTVSPGREADWSVPLYQMQSTDGRLTGLGMGNMKAGTAALAMAFVWLAKNSELWPGTISYTAVADETVFGPDGAGWLLAQRPDITGHAVICGEGPGHMNLAVAEKGLLWVKLTATAPSGQGMLARPAGSAITRLARALTEIDGWNDEQASPPAELSVVKPHAGTEGLRLSVNTGTVHGGQFVSQIATEAVAEIDFRIPHGLSTSDIEARLDALCARHERLAWDRMKGWEPNWTNPDEAIVRAVAASLRTLGQEPVKPVVRLPASDASRWRTLGVPAVCFGPQPTLASGVDDFAWADDILMCARTYCLSALLYLNGGR